MNLIDVVRELGTEEEGFAFFERMRWPDGVVRCTTCGNDHISRITRKSTTKNVRKNLYQCLEPTCKQQFSVTSGTIFHDTRIPLAKWFMAISLIMDAKKGISAKQLQEHLGLGSYQTAWHMTHRIRKAMVDTNPTPMSGTVEIDETYIGPTAIRRGQKGRRTKEMVFAIRERSTPTKTGRVRFFHVPNGKRVTLEPIITDHIAPWVNRINTDQSSVYDFAIHETFNSRHRTVNHSMQWIVPGSKIHTNTVESSFSLLKRGLIGSFHRVSIKHLHRYLSEFEHRFNTRKDVDRFTDMVMRVAQTSPLTYRTLVDGPTQA
jgi:transposase-like protein